VLEGKKGHFLGDPLEAKRAGGGGRATGRNLNKSTGLDGKIGLRAKSSLPDTCSGGRGLVSPGICWAGPDRLAGTYDCPEIV